MNASLGDVDVAAIKILWQELEPEVSRAAFLEQAAQTVTRGLFESYAGSVALARAFVTVPLDGLPDSNQAWVRGLAGRAGVESALEPSTPILSLIGSYGAEESWRDRRRSEGHVGIPLVSASFVDGIPMVARLLQQLGMELDWLGRGDTDIIARVLGSSSGVFFVAEAAQETDRKGRKVIAAQEFVARHRIRSVFGFGGAYFGGSIITFILFCTRAIERTVAQRFAPLVNLFKAATVSLAGSTSVFAD
jgi:hypothetical protein